MLTVILDTNVIVSALISNSVPTQILYQLVFKQAVQPCLSVEVFAEYVDVLGQDKFSRFPAFRSKADVVWNLPPSARQTT